MQDGLPQKNRIVIVSPKIDDPAKPEIPPDLRIAQTVPEILAHVEKEIGSHLPQTAHDIEK